jgi:hypothetical protein
MFAKRRNAAQAVIDRLIAAENGIDDALSLAADLTGFMPKARMSADLAAEVGHEAIAHAHQACQHLVLARAAMVQTHQKLAEVRDEIGLKTVSFGGLMGKPKAALRHLIAVKDAA